MSDTIIADAAREVLQTTACAHVSAGAALDGANRSADSVIAVLGMVGSRPGTLVLFCQPTIASALAGGMLNMSADQLDDATVTDALGELVNQIGGTIKRKLAASGGEIMLAVPSVVRGSSMALKVMGDGTPLAVDLQVDGGSVSLRYWQPKQAQG